MNLDFFPTIVLEMNVPKITYQNHNILRKYTNNQKHSFYTQMKHFQYHYFDVGRNIQET